MSRSTSIRTLLVIACVAVAAPVAAQQLPRARAGIGAGVTSPRGAYHADDFGEGFNSGWQGMVFLEFREPNRPIGLRVDVVIGENPANDAFNNTVGATAKMRLFGGNIDLLYSFGRTPGGPRVYALAGVGTYRITLSSKAGGIAAADQSENKFGWNAGAGATLPLGRVAGFLEVRYFNLSTTFIQGEKAPFVAIVAGVRFGGN